MILIDSYRFVLSRFGNLNGLFLSKIFLFGKKMDFTDAATGHKVYDFTTVARFKPLMDC